MSTNVAIVDNRDPLLHYAGGWVEGGAPVEFNDTTIWTGTRGATISFTFIGSSIAAYATVAAVNQPNASMSFLVDNSIPGAYTPHGVTTTTPHSLLWQSPTMDDTSHTLVITQTAAQSGGVIFFDYLLYNTTSTNVHSFFVDDSDPRITYTGGWEEVLTDDDFQHTSHNSTKVGDSLSLQFVGKSISLYGDWVPGATSNASFAIDGGPPLFIPSTPPAARTTNNLLFNSGDLANGNHTLVVSAANDQPVLVDYFLVTPNGPGPTSPSTTSGSSAASSSSGLSVGSNSVQTKKSTPIGAIVGPVVGVLVLIALLVAALLVYRRRRAHARQGPQSKPDTFQTTPYPYSSYSDSNSPSGDSGLTAYHARHAHVWRPGAPPPGAMLPSSPIDSFGTSDAATQFYPANSVNPPSSNSEIPSRSKGTREARELRQWNINTNARAPASAAGQSTVLEEPPQYVA
ncbi:hypothetical protein C8F04DRAFT_389207 [Mycena alexandri]|uniref:Transmembrane protein n=1 Tax=Mycena alexandri TaxID=1745969 RepID=A0AAD6X643_9AGAR|nr:hypothetical protein C8F04DRAFT_389207 [Mycena alexandri]